MSTPSSTTPGTPNSLLHVPGQHADIIQRLKNVPGYTTPVFKGKEEQRAKVQATVAAKVSIVSFSAHSFFGIALRVDRVSPAGFQHPEALARLPYVVSRPVRPFDTRIEVIPERSAVSPVVRIQRAGTLDAYNTGSCCPSSAYKRVMHVNSLGMRSGSIHCIPVIPMRVRVPGYLRQPGQPCLISRAIWLLPMDPLRWAVPSTTVTLRAERYRDSLSVWLIHSILVPDPQHVLARPACSSSLALSASPRRLDRASLSCARV
ncbi:hypothetical protein NUW54_g9452 [Trametes sanguinea]|uniref:Uncharacterized protein n=1 Tax=Trametes sanguinea TaxID=158606 RepID=A0ACC1P5W3_9APHY|nr:hypothetical protein NUW54_g9452 [Trametes sanguinea]